MSSSKHSEFSHESMQDSQSIVKYLEALAEGFRAGKLVLENGDKQIVLDPTGLLKLDLSAKKSDKRMKLSMKISWKGDEEMAEIESKPLAIKSQAQA